MCKRQFMVVKASVWKESIYSQISLGLDFRNQEKERKLSLKKVIRESKQKTVKWKIEKIKEKQKCLEQN